MIYNTSDIIKDVKVIIDENMDSSPLLQEGDIDTLSLEEIIQSKITGAVEEIAKQAPVRLLGIGCPFGNDIIWRDRPGYGPGYVILPGDFMRLVTFQMSDWTRPVTTFVTENDLQYQQLQSRYPGISGNPQNPAVAIVMDAANMILEFYSCSAGEGVHIRKARYLPFPVIKDGTVDIPKRIYQSALYYIAAQTLVSLSQMDLAKALIEISKNKLQ